MHFFLFFCEKIWSIQKKAVLLHPLSRESDDLLEINKEKKCGNSSVGRAQPCQGWGREFESRFPLFFFAQMAELVDACVSGAHAARCAGSSPVLGTKKSCAGGEIGIHATLRG